MNHTCGLAVNCKNEYFSVAEVFFIKQFKVFVAVVKASLPYFAKRGNILLRGGTNVDIHILYLHGKGVKACVSAVEEFFGFAFYHLNSERSKMLRVVVILPRSHSEGVEVNSVIA